MVKTSLEVFDSIMEIVSISEMTLDKTTCT